MCNQLCSIYYNNIVLIVLQDATVMKRDIHFARHVMQADFEQKLQQKAIDL